MHVLMMLDFVDVVGLISMEMILRTSSLPVLITLRRKMLQSVNRVLFLCFLVEGTSQSKTTENEFICFVC